MGSTIDSDNQTVTGGYLHTIVHLIDPALRTDPRTDPRTTHCWHWNGWMTGDGMQGE